MKELRLNAFDMNCVVHQSAGLWTHPRDRAETYTDLDYWTNLAQILEAGKFDAIFLADVLGVYDVYGGNNAAALARGAQIPLNDPALVIPPMAHVTQNLGFGLTGTLSFEPPPTSDLVARIMGRLFILPYAFGRAVQITGDNVPSDPPFGKVIQGRESPCELKSTWKSCTSCGKVAGKTTRPCEIG